MIFWAAALGVTIIAFFSAYFLVPSWQEQKRIERLEEEFPLLLSLCAAHAPLESFENAMAHASFGSNVLSLEFARVMADIKSGKTVVASLTGLANRTPSPLIQRACLQLCFSYAHGDASGLTALSHEFQQLQQVRLRAFASKASFLSAWFVVLSGVVPALFTAYVIIGSSMLSFSYSAEFVLTALCIGFPSILALLTGYAAYSSPGGS